jgi:hypothetical protein
VSQQPVPAVGILANPMSGRDVRRLAARASTTTLEIKRDQVARAAVGAVAGGARRIAVVHDVFRIATSAVEHLGLDAEIVALGGGAEVNARDSLAAARALREAGCQVLIVLGGDGTNRAVARAWRDVPLVPLSTGTNNVFPLSVEATAAGAAAGLVASGRVRLDEVARAQKCVHVEIDGEPDDLALIDAVLLADDHVGNFMPVEARRIRDVVLARAEPTAVGVSSLGGLTLPCGVDDDFGVALRCGEHAGGGRPLWAPISPGLFRTVHVEAVRKVALGEPVEVRGPGVLAFDGDRERELAAGHGASLCVRRDGPRVLDVARALALGASAGAFFDRGPWRDAFDGALGGDSCC